MRRERATFLRQTSQNYSRTPPFRLPFKRTKIAGWAWCVRAAVRRCAAHALGQRRGMRRARPIARRRLVPVRASFCGGAGVPPKPRPCCKRHASPQVLFGYNVTYIDAPEFYPWGHCKDDAIMIHYNRRASLVQRRYDRILKGRAWGAVGTRTHGLRGGAAARALSRISFSLPPPPPFSLCALAAGC